jgi:phage shock protein A
MDQKDQQIEEMRALITALQQNLHAATDSVVSWQARHNLTQQQLATALAQIERLEFRLKDAPDAGAPPD